MRVFVHLLAALLTTGAGLAQTVFEIGRRDDGYAELALGTTGYQAFAARFPEDPIIDAEAPDATARFPYVQPSDHDAWAGAREHPLTLTFRLADAPVGWYRLTVDLIAAHWGAPPIYQAELNGVVRFAWLPPFDGDDRVLRDPSYGAEVVRELWWPADAFKQVENRLVLTTLSGSWILYDALVFERLDGPPSTAGSLFVVGRHDGSYREFALADRGYGAFPAACPGTIIVNADGPQPERELPFILPGPTDAWAGGTAHPLVLRFRLAEPPDEDGCLLVDLVAAHGQSPPTLRVAINDQAVERTLRPGPGDRVLADPAAGRRQVVAVTFPASCFRAGNNTITLTAVRGSWILFDAIELGLVGGRRAPALTNLRLVPRPVRLRGADHEQLVRCSVQYWGPAVDAALGIEGEGWSLTRAVPGLRFGENTAELAVPALTEPREVTATLRAGDLTVTTTATLAPVPDRTVYICPSIHTDIGYTHLQPECAQRHVDSLLAIMDACADTRGYPEDARLRWNCEVTWEVEQLERLAPERAEEFYALCRAGRIGVSAAYANLLTGLPGHEQICRIGYPAARLRREHGLAIDVATMTDNPSYIWSLPTVLAGSDVRYFAVGCNDSRGVFAAGNPLRPPVWWAGPDDESVLYWFAGGYGMADGLGLFDSLAAAEAALPDWVAGHGETDMVLAYGGVGDNQLVTREAAVRLADTVRAWNERYETPRLRLATFTEYFSEYHRRHGATAPAARGDGGAYWEDGAASSARETALNRATHELHSTAEKLHAWIRGIDPTHPYPTAPLAAVLRDSLLYDEHTWGAYNSITDPDSQFVKGQWKIKSSFATAAFAGAEQAVDSGLRALADRVAGAETDSLLVFNPLSWERSELVTIPAPDRPVRLVDSAGGAAIPQQLCDDQLVFFAAGVPPIGYRLYRVVPADTWPASPPTLRAGGDLAITAGPYRLTLSPSGGLTSLRDGSGREWIDASRYRLGQIIYDRGSAEPWGAKVIERTLATGGDIAYAQGDLLGWAEMPVALPALGPAALRLTWSPHTPALGVELRVDKRRCLEPETVFLAFPFDLPGARFRYELPLAVAEAETDQLPNACRDWYAVQHFVDVSNSDAGITWTTRDAFLAEFADIQTGRWLRELPHTSATIFANLMNNLWFTNYKLDQEGPVRFRFALLPHANGFDRAAASRFGFEHANPMLTALVPAGQDGVLPESASLLTVAGPPAVVLTVKAPEHGTGTIVRLYDISGETAERDLRFSIPVSRASRCNLVEDDLGPLAAADGVVRVPLSAGGVTTVRIEP